MGALGPALGFLCGALFISFYEDPFNGPPAGISEGDLAWVGAWWAGIVIGAALIFVFGITLFFFPKQILFKPEKRETEEEEETERSLVTREKMATSSREDSACYGYDRSTTSCVDDGDATDRPASASTWGTDSFTSSGIASGSGANSGGGDVSNVAGDVSPEVFVRQNAASASNASDAAGSSASPLKAAAATSSPSSPAGRAPSPPPPTDDLLPLPSGISNPSSSSSSILWCWAFASSFANDLFAILFNPVWLLLTMFTVGEVIVVDAFIVFGPKYIQTVFNVDASSANILSGIVMVPSAVIGMILGGYLLRRYRLSLRGQLWFLVLCAVTSLSAVFGLMFVSCTNVQIAGFNIGYDNGEPDMNVTVNYLPKANLTSRCNLNCDCDDHWYEPVCGANQKTYFNPCYAGCQDLKVTKTPEGTTIWNYTQCSCVYSDIEYRHHDFDNNNHHRDRGAIVGRCHQPCHSIYVFLLIFAVAVFAGCCAQSPVLVITLGTVDEKMKSFALGLQYFLQRGMAYIPTPIYFGYIIDSTCLIWQWNCSPAASGGPSTDTRGLCLEYDRKRLPPTMFGSSLAVKTVGLFFLVLCAICTRKRDTDDDDDAAKDVISDADSTSPVSSSDSKDAQALPNDAAHSGTGAVPPTPFADNVTPLRHLGSSTKIGDDSPATSSEQKKTPTDSTSKRRGPVGARRSLFRHRKLEDADSDDDESGTPESVTASQTIEASSSRSVGATTKPTPSPTTFQKQTSGVKSNPGDGRSPVRAWTRSSGKKGGADIAGSSVRYDRMRRHSEVELTIDGKGKNSQGI